MSDSILQGKIESALKLEWAKLPGRYERKVYCWRRYLARLKGFKTVSLSLLIANIGTFSDYVVVVDPSCSLGNGPAPGQRLVVAHKEFVTKSIFMGLPDISSMNFKKPHYWSKHDQLGLEFELPNQKGHAL